jgi:type II pantothenate kinase
VYCGSTLTANAPLETILAQVTGFFGPPPRFLEQGAFCGAIGAASCGGA